VNPRELQQTFVLANEFKEGDLLVGGTANEQVRREARKLLSALRVREIMKAPLVEDGVTDALARSLDRQLASDLSSLTIEAMKQILLRPDAAAWVQHYRDGLASEVIAAVVKVMTNEELAMVAQKLFNPLPGLSFSIGSDRHFGSRIQPNSPGDDEEEILFSILEGLSYGCGDVMIGLNPASDDVETIIRLEKLLCQVVERLELPTRTCVLSDIVKQTTARNRARVDVGFQSLAGTSKALRGMVGLDVEGILDLAREFSGLYFETGQGSEVTNQAAEGVDMVTLEARTYGVARSIRHHTGTWMIVNDVAGFIGPEVFRTAGQLERMCLEDTVMGKLHGLTMGLDVCSTFHMGVDPKLLGKVTEETVEKAAPAYLMAVAGNADPMLGYLTTSFREHPRFRRKTGRKISTAMQRRLTQLGVMNESGEILPDGSRTESLYATYVKAGGDTRSFEMLRQEAAKKIRTLQERGYDLGYGHRENYLAPPEVDTRIEAIYRHARRALYASLDEAGVKQVSNRHIRIRTHSVDREDYLAHPRSGELIREKDAPRLGSLYPSSRRQVQFVISDGLNANAVNENLRSVLPELRERLRAAGYHVGEVDIMIENGRVRAGYHVGLLVDPDIGIHLIGERPGTGLNTLSAYLTYGRDKAGNSRWQDIDHSHTTAICGIHPHGKQPGVAVEEILGCVKLMFEKRCSGVELRREGKTRYP
jgi:ethanolamine ammonia-lyase large subunit